MSKCKKTQWR